MDSYGNQFQSGVPSGSALRGESNAGMNTLMAAGMITELSHGYLSSSWLEKNFLSKARQTKINGKKNVKAFGAKKRGEIAKDLGMKQEDIKAIIKERYDRVGELLKSNKYKGVGYQLRHNLVGSRMKADPKALSGTIGSHDWTDEYVKAAKTRGTKRGLFGFLDDAETSRRKGIVRRVNQETMHTLARTPGSLQGTARAFVSAKSFARLANYATVADMAFSLGKGAFSGAASLGATLRYSGGNPTPFASGFSDSEMAYTMRQRSSQAIQRAQIGARRSLGSEASMLHSAR